MSFREVAPNTGGRDVGYPVSAALANRLSMIWMRRFQRDRSFTEIALPPMIVVFSNQQLKRKSPFGTTAHGLAVSIDHPSVFSVRLLPFLFPSSCFLFVLLLVDPNFFVAFISVGLVRPTGVHPHTVGISPVTFVLIPAKRNYVTIPTSLLLGQNIRRLISIAGAASRANDFSVFKIVGRESRANLLFMLLSVGFTVRQLAFSIVDVISRVVSLFTRMAFISQPVFLCSVCPKLSGRLIYLARRAGFFGYTLISQGVNLRDRFANWSGPLEKSHSLVGRFVF